MPHKAEEISALAVGRLRDGVHTVGGVPGLRLQVIGAARSWTLRFSVGGRRREAGLGPYPEVSLKRARELAREAREVVRAGHDPILERKKRSSAVASAKEHAKTFDFCATAYIQAKQSEWSNRKHAEQWQNTLATYASPLVGSMLVGDVDTPHVLRILEPHWRSKTETMVRLRGRLEVILDWAVARGYRSGPNPARWKGHLEHMLAKPSKVANAGHHPALPYRDMPAFMRRLRNVDGDSAKALEFAIFTAARSSEVRGMTWDEVDLQAKTWTVPASRMKAKKPHRVPLCAEAARLLAARSGDRSGGLVFASARSRSQLSDMAMTLVCRRLGVEAVPHGLARATFKTWAAEQTAFPREVIEQALAHTLENKTEDAYWRGDMFDKRVALMNAWGTFLAS